MLVSCDWAYQETSMVTFSVLLKPIFCSGYKTPSIAKFLLEKFVFPLH